MRISAFSLLFLLPVAAFATTDAVAPKQAAGRKPQAALAALAAPGASTNAVAAPRPLRNPFWPIGYEGKRAVISAENRAPAPARPSSPEVPEESADAVAADVATPQHWIAARRSLRVGGTVIVRDDDGSTRTSAIINGNAYADGDFISVTHHGRRFTWRVKGLTDSGVLKLVRIRARLIVDPNVKGIKP